MDHQVKPKRLNAAAGDATRASNTARAKAHLERLAESRGKRVVVDLNADERASLERLVATGYAENQSAAIRLAITSAAQGTYELSP